MTDISMQHSEQWLKQLLQLAGISTNVYSQLGAAPTLETAPSEPNSYWLIIDDSYLRPEQIRVLIGTSGSVLDAIQSLANSVLNLHHQEQEEISYIIELNGYRVLRQAEINTLVKTAAQEVRFSGREVEISSLNSAERRQVHSFLKEFPDLETFSRGREPNRNLVIRLATPSPANPDYSS
ncbi:R3H domain-containing nucleic acid-binding protein [Cylindrospermopsis raciborskii]|uniref:RNA-binding protein n=1 Tax=Cylindrospermopsis raciborskii CENA302 TaxID=1170768 RepID=A0A9Q5QX77_9CYAN|nr:R3H domain-containing nucleic acid-binding protein [Cylindrospermopsis raciborskii]MCZ2205589.1 RNA-binding protein [Cylindrospermopsis raciborskii PAMP2011]NLQ05751.1 RNA-binding protein [Cylindrospermopsis raciborskii MVCC19]OHY36335.1 RNA-binding protein [Cylindrospermopsis raciborskii MVCC14]OPH09814.1 RNA-binding protein [Cylindrospermopsis raciborskii CENA302]